MKLLVTGGCGFIGSNFIRSVLSKYPDYKIVNLDALTYAGNTENLFDINKNKNYSFVRGDIGDGGLVKKLIRSVNVVVNFAASTHVDRSIEDAGDFIRTNVYGTYSLLEAAREAKLKLFLHISTDEVYGSVNRGASGENDVLLPNSPYSASKAASDHLVRSYGVTYNLPVITTRSSNNFGPYQYPEKVIPLFITNLFEGKKIPLYGDGKNVRDWIFVLDNCSAIDCVLHKGKTGEVYNIGGGNNLTNIELTKRVLKLAGKPLSCLEYVADRKGHDRRYALNCDKLKLLGWKPEYSFSEALAFTFDWYKNNQKWWKKLK